MPLKAGSNKATVSSNIQELMHSFHGSGKIGTSHSMSDMAASKQATAIAYSKARKARGAKQLFKKKRGRA